MPTELKMSSLAYPNEFALANCSLGDGVDRLGLPQITQLQDDHGLRRLDLRYEASAVPLGTI